MSEQFPYVHPLVGVRCRVVSVHEWHGETAEIEEPNMAKKPGTSEEQSGVQSLRHAFSLLVAAEMQRYPKLSRQQAIRRVANSEPSLYLTYLDTLPTIGPRGRK